MAPCGASSYCVSRASPSWVAARLSCVARPTAQAAVTPAASVRPCRALKAAAAEAPSAPCARSPRSASWASAFARSSVRRTAAHPRATPESPMPVSLAMAESPMEALRGTQGRMEGFPERTAASARQASASATAPAWTRRRTRSTAASATAPARAPSSARQGAVNRKGPTAERALPVRPATPAMGAPARASRVHRRTAERAPGRAVAPRPTAVDRR